MLCKSCKQEKPDNYAKEKLLKTCKECREIELEKERKRNKKTKEEKEALVYDRTTHSCCQYKKCLVIFENEYFRGKLRTKCFEHKEAAYKAGKAFENRQKEKIKDKKETYVDDDNIGVCNNCAEEFLKFTNKQNKISLRCQDCCEKEKTCKQKYYNDNPNAYEERKARARFVQAYKLYRAKKIEEIGIEEYRKYNSKKHREYFEKNKEKLLSNLAENKQKIENRYKKMVREAKEKRNIEVELTFEEFSEIVKNNCYYCNNDKEISVDRIDSSEGYSFDNSLPCCTYCNNIKAAMDLQSFMKKCKNIIKFNNLTEVKDDFDYDIKQSVSISYSSYKDRAKNKELAFEITKEDCISIAKTLCYLCGQENTKSHKNGIDRVNNDIGYTLDNCKACCSSCNYMKREYLLQKFLNQILKIYTKCYENLKYIKCKPCKCLEQTRDKLSNDELKEIKKEKKTIKTKKVLEKYNVEKVKKEVEKRREMLKK